MDNPFSPVVLTTCRPVWGLLVGLVLLCMPFTPARAGLFGGHHYSDGHCDPTDDDKAEASRVIRTLNTRLDTLDRDLIDTLTKATAQLSLYVKQLGTLETRLTDGAQKQDADLARQQKRTSIIRDLLPQKIHCATITGLAGLAATSARTHQVTEDGMENALDRLAQNGESGPVGRAVDTRARVDALRRWQPETCTNHDRAAFLAGRATCLVNADIDPLSLLGPATLDSAPTQAAAHAWIDTLIAPPAEDPLPLGALTSEADRRDFLARRTRLARRALAWYSLLSIQASRSPAVRLGSWANAILPPDLAKGALKRGDTLSKDDFYQLIARDYFARPDYFISLQGLTPANRQLEALRNQAVMLMLTQESYRQRQTTNVLLATLLAHRLDQTPCCTAGQGVPPNTAPQNR